MTVLFADLAGFTALSETMDPEDVKGLATEISQRVAQEARAFGGTPLRVIGDAVMVVFGAPVGHEDDAERAVRAGFAMRSAISEMTVGEKALQLHVGINTGLTIAGMVGPEELHEYSVMGDVTNTAARLMSAAPPGSVFVGDETYRATRYAVVYREVGPIAAKGKSEAVRAWEALRVQPLPHRRPITQTPFVGRDNELSSLTSIWSDVVEAKHPRAVTLIGEPGVGKTRLVAEFEQQIDATLLHGRCLPYGEPLGHWAFAQIIGETAGVTPADSAQEARAKLGALTDSLTLHDDKHAVAARVALLSGLDVPDDRDYEGDQKTLHTAARNFLNGLAQRAPICLIFEDLHWADSALLDLVEHLVAETADAALLVLGAARPDLIERRPGWGHERRHTRLDVRPFDDDTVGDLVAALCRDRGLPTDSVADVSRNVQGNPLFAEEWVAMLVEREVVDTIPPSVRTMIAARFDGLPPQERRVVQLAGVFGAVFWDDALPALDGPVEVGLSLTALQDRGMIRAVEPSRFPGVVQYEFKHALIRDVAYEILPRAERRGLHGRAADWIANAAGTRSDEFLDLLVYHSTRADQDDRAVGYLTRAAARSRRSSAHREEAALLGQAIEIAERSADATLAARLHADRARAVAAIGLWAEARSEMETALAGLPSDEAEARTRALIDLANYCNWTFEIAKSDEYSQAAVILAEELGRTDLMGAAIATSAIVDSANAELERSLEKFRHAFALAGASSPILIQGMGWEALLLYWLGRFDEAIARGTDALEVARSAGDTNATLFTLGNLGMAYAGSGRYEDALSTYEAARRFGSEHRVASVGRAIAMEGGLYLDLFDYERAEATATEARELGRSSGFHQSHVSGGIDLLFNFARRGEVGRVERLIPEVGDAVEVTQGAHGWLWRLRFLQARAEISLAAADYEDALRYADEVIRLSRGNGRVKYQAAALGTRSRALFAAGKIEDGLTDAKQAVDLARPTGDPAMLLRAAMTLLDMDGDESLLAEANACIQRIAHALGVEMRERFLAADPVQRVTRWSQSR